MGAASLIGHPAILRDGTPALVYCTDIIDVADASALAARPALAAPDPCFFTPQA